MSLICTPVPSDCSVHGPKLGLSKLKCIRSINTDLGFSAASVLLCKLALISPYYFQVWMHIPTPSLGSMFGVVDSSMVMDLHSSVGPSSCLQIKAMQSPACSGSNSIRLSSLRQGKNAWEAANLQDPREILPSFFFFIIFIFGSAK